MSASAQRLDVNLEKRHKNGVNKYVKMIEECGSWAIRKVPLALREDVMSLDAKKQGVVVNRRSGLTDMLLKTAPKREGINPYHELEVRLKEGGGNGGEEAAPLVSRLANVYHAKPKITLKKSGGN